MNKTLKDWVIVTYCMLLTLGIIFLMVIAAQQNQEITSYKQDLLVYSQLKLKQQNTIDDLNTEIDLHEKNELAWEQKDWKCEGIEIKDWTE